MSLIHSELLRILSYSRQTGIWHWRVGLAMITKVGDVAGTIDGTGYRRIQIDGRRYLSSRLAWFYVTGKWPARQIDHKDTDPANDAWSNLRLATNGQNGHNQGKRSDNTSGYRGVSFHKRAGKYRAYIGEDGRRYSLGYFDTPELAARAYNAAAIRLHGKFAQLNRVGR